MFTWFAGLHGSPTHETGAGSFAAAAAAVVLVVVAAVAVVVYTDFPLYDGVHARCKR
jgi:hypothetical protein